MGALSLGHILMVLLVVILVFGTKKLGGLGSDLGEAIRGFRKAMATDDPPPGPTPAAESTATSTTTSPDISAKTTADDRQTARHP